jgi:tartronate-semialdehyde synthase
LSYDMNLAVNIGYDGPDIDYGIDNVVLVEAMGALGCRVTRPEDTKDALDWAVRASEEQRVSARVEMPVERETNASIGLSIDRISEYEPILEWTREAYGDRTKPNERLPW